MNRATTRAGPSRPAIWLPVLTIALTVVVFGVVLGLVSLRLRADLRQQIAGRDAHGLSQMAYLWGLADAAEAPVDPESGLPSVTGNPELDALVQAERLKEMVGRMNGLLLVARLFDVNGLLVFALPPGLTESPLETNDLATLRRLEPVSRFRSHVRQEDLFPGGPTPTPGLAGTRPILEVAIPLRGAGQDSLVGIAQLLLDGGSIEVEFAALDRHLLRQAAGVFGVGCVILVAGLAGAFHRLHRANRLLHERTTGLLRANEELARVARLSAVGAVTAHLIHGLKNPLSGLQQFVRGRGEGAPPPGEELWTEARQSTQQAQQLLAEVTRVLQEERGITGYELSFVELLDLMKPRLSTATEAAGVALGIRGNAPGTITNREANLLLLILENVLSNAIEATPSGAHVDLELRAVPEAIEFVVRDQGPGLAEELRPRLFTPVPSTKPNGSGLGLAISQQLAHHLGARLELRESGPRGCTFVLSLPRPSNSASRADALASLDARSS